MKQLLIALLLMASYSATTDSSKHYPKPTDVIKLNKQQYAVFHHIALAMIPGTPQNVGKIVKFYGSLKGNENIQRLKSIEEIERYRTSLENAHYICYKPKKSLRVFLGADDTSTVLKYYANKTNTKDFTAASSILDNTKNQAQ